MDTCLKTSLMPLALFSCASLLSHLLSYHNFFLLNNHSFTSGVHMCILSPRRSVLQPSTYINFTKLIKTKVAHYIRYIDQYLNYIRAGFRKTKTKIITPANQKGRRQSSEPIKWLDVITCSWRKARENAWNELCSYFWLDKQMVGVFQANGIT